ncbi:hypothetical protein F5Y03DRAFT_405107 [Xylaria venustula]|nr:hypothetical protein F5Y03DRAFT_405107 [Xylaria venustula]
MTEIMRMPLPTNQQAAVDTDKNSSEAGPMNPPVKKRTPLPTLPYVPAHERAEAERVLAAARRRSAQVKRFRAAANKYREENEVDPSQSPSLKGANGVILKSGKYCCNICGSLLNNKKALIKCHNSKMHPKNPVKSSAYLRQRAPKASPCGECGKICSSLDMLRKHTVQAHFRTGQPTSPLANECQP